ncbi:MAG: helix-turn-helix transcriptional regulator [Liquorilactobacillus nagelii]|nr:helix-turn-helix transcriptional regulator [Liquorilactobacillus nagelii]MCI1921768.1 helix-turn-helix transcriptional regulator [Liquorilactobacillus nagelii]
MKGVLDILKFILNDFMSSHHLSIQDVSTMTGISRNTISQLYNGKSRGIQFETLDKLCFHLECEPNDLIKIFPDSYTFYIPDSELLEPQTKKDNFQYSGFLLTTDEMKEINNHTRKKIGFPISIEIQKKNDKNHVLDIFFGIPFHEDTQLTRIYNGDFSLINKTSNALKNLTVKNLKTLAYDVTVFLIKKQPFIFRSIAGVNVLFKLEPEKENNFKLSIIKIPNILNLEL